MLEIEEITIDEEVYDLQIEGDHSFVANGIVVHNCSMLPIIQGLEPIPFLSGEAYFRSLSSEDQRAWMGNERYELWQRGRFAFTQMAKIKDNQTWGPSSQVRPVKELKQIDREDALVDRFDLRRFR